MDLSALDNFQDSVIYSNETFQVIFAAFLTTCLGECKSITISRVLVIDIQRPRVQGPQKADWDHEYQDNQTENTVIPGKIII